MLTVEPGIQAAGVVVVAVRGSADIHSAEVLEASLRKVSASDPRLVVLDLCGVDILTSLAIGVLVGFRTKVMAGGGRVVIAGAPVQIVRTMRFTRVSELFPQYPTVDEARAAGA